MQTLTKSDFAELILTKGITTSKFTAKQMAQDVVNLYKSAIFCRKTIYIPKLCRLNVIVKAARPGRNPQTGEAVTIARRHSITASNSGRGSMWNKLTKSATIRVLVTYSYTQLEAWKIIEAFYEMVRLVDAGTHRIELRGLGVFYPRTLAAGVKRNPKSGESIHKRASISVAFRCAPALRRAVDREYLT